MKLISLNIENNLHYKTVLLFLKTEKPDVICLQEVLEEDFEFFKKELNLEGVFLPFSYVKSKTCEKLIGKKTGCSNFFKKYN